MYINSYLLFAHTRARARTHTHTYGYMYLKFILYTKDIIVIYLINVLLSLMFTFLTF